MVIAPFGGIHTVTMVYSKSKLLTGKDGVSSFQTELFAFDKNSGFSWL